MPMGIVFILCIRPSVQLSVSLDFWYCGQISCKKKSTFWHADVFGRLALSLFMPMGIMSIRLFTTLWAISAFADKSFGRNGITKFDMLMYSDDLPQTAPVPMGIVISCIHPSGQLSMSLGFGIVDKSLGWKDYILACWCIQMTYSQFIHAYGYYCPSVSPPVHSPHFQLLLPTWIDQLILIPARVSDYIH